MLQNFHKDDIDLVSLLFQVNNTKNGWFDFLNKFNAHFNFTVCGILVRDKNGEDFIIKNLSKGAINASDIDDILNMYFSEKVQSKTKSNEKNKTDIKFHVSVFETLNKSDKYSQIFFGLSTKYSNIINKRINQFTPYINNALEIKSRLEEKKIKSEILQYSLDQYKLPAAIYSQSEKIMIANTEFINVLRTEKILSIESKNLIKPDNPLGIRVVNTITKAIINLNSTSENKLSGSLNIYGKTEYLIGFQRIEGISHIKDLSILFIASPEFTAPISISTLLNTFNLTPSEATVCHLFTSGTSLEGISTIENKSLHTVREQLKSCYLKTNTKSQLGLMKLVSSLPVK